jgi:hypothetical protein
LFAYSYTRRVDCGPWTGTELAGTGGPRTARDRQAAAKRDSRIGRAAGADGAPVWDSWTGSQPESGKVGRHGTAHRVTASQAIAAQPNPGQAGRHPGRGGRRDADRGRRAGTGRQDRQDRRSAVPDDTGVRDRTGADGGSAARRLREARRRCGGCARESRRRWGEG